MLCRIVELRHKEVINRSNGCRIGFADDVEVDTLTSKVKSIIVFGRPRLLGIFGKSDDVIIPWDDIELIGEDTILVASDVKYQQKRKRTKKLFG